MVATSCPDSESLPHRESQPLRHQIKGLTLGKSYWLAYCWPEVQRTLRVIRNDVLRVAISLLFHWKVSIYNIGMIGVIVALSMGIYCLLAYEPYNYTPCFRGGDFSLFLKYNRFAMRRAFQITLGFGHLTFAQAKVIDIVWDVVVGRGGQGILAIISYRISSKCLTRLMEREHFSATYRLYEAIVFRDASLKSIWQLCTCFTRKMKSQDLAAIYWIILASSYVVVFPTSVSAMTGYSSNVSPFLGTYTDSKVPWQSRRALYNIHDGVRIGKTVDYVVGSEGFGSDSYDYYAGDSAYYSCLEEIDYTKQYGSYGGDSLYQPCYFANSTSNCKADLDAYPHPSSLKNNFN